MGTEPTEKKPSDVEGGALPDPALRAAILAKHVALAFAVCASTALVIDYQHVGEPAFCGVESACFQVRLSPYSHLFGVPLPNLALPAFAILMGGSIFAKTALHHRLLGAAAGVGALMAVALIALQALAIGAFCQWCMIVDSSAIVAGASAIGIALWTRGDDARAAKASVHGAASMAWAVTGTLAIALPFLWARFPEVPPPPPPIAAQLTPGKITIVSYTDFECPFCRKLHPTMDVVREKYKDQIRFLRKMKPLSGHPGAMPAARAWVCAPEAKKDEVAAALYEMDPADLKREKILDLAEKMSLGPREAFAECMASKATDAAIDRDAAEFAAIKGKGLPFTYVNARVIIGMNADRLVSSVEAELGGPSTNLPVWVMFTLLALLVAGACGLTWVARPEPASASD